MNAIKRFFFSGLTPKLSRTGSGAQKYTDPDLGQQVKVAFLHIQVSASTICSRKHPLMGFAHLLPALFDCESRFRTNCCSLFYYPLLLTAASFMPQTGPFQPPDAPHPSRPPGWNLRLPQPQTPWRVGWLTRLNSKATNQGSRSNSARLHKLPCAPQ